MGGKEKLSKIVTDWYPRNRRYRQFRRREGFKTITGEIWIKLSRVRDLKAFEKNKGYIITNIEWLLCLTLELDLGLS